MSLRDAIQLTKKREGHSFERFRNIIRAELVAIDDDVEVTGRPGYVWAKEVGQAAGVFQVFNPNTQSTSGLPVLIGHEPNQPHRRVVLGWDWETLPWSSEYDGDPYLPNHHPSHEWPDGHAGADAVTVYPRSLSMLRTYPGGGLTVNISPLRYEVNGDVTQFLGHEAYDLTGSVPAAGEARYVLVYLDSDTNTISHTDGEITVDADPIVPEIPDASIRSVPSAAVRLAGGDTVIVESSILDVRMILTRITGEQASILDAVAWAEEELDYELSKHNVEHNQAITDLLALVEAELDFALSTHIAG